VSIDLSQFYQVFFEEAAEHLDTMESLLLGLDIANPDSEQLNAVFRAAHSIKGSSGTFGFTDMAEVTHVLENLLDRIRKGELALRDQMIDAFLDAGDVLKTMLAVHKGEGEPNAAAVEAIVVRLRSLTGGASLQPVSAVAEPACAAVRAGYDIYFILAGDPAVAKATVDNLIAELGQYGAARLVAEPATSGESWRVELLGQAVPDTLRNVIEFVAHSDSIRIEPSGAPAPAGSADGAYGFFDEKPAKPPAAAEAYGLFEPPSVAMAPPVVADKAGDQTAKAVAAKGGGGDSTLRVGVEKVDQLINLVGELVITQAMLLQSATDVDSVVHERLHDGLAQLERNSRDLQEAVMSIRMMPISVVFSRFPRVVREVSQKLGKKVELKLVGEGTELDKSLIERLADPLTHLIRNSLDHGIEMPEVRAGRGKPPVGTITLKAYHHGGNIVIEVGDDGAGLNREKILAKAREKDLAVNDQMTDQEVWQLIFAAGFSTADVVTEVSGRGVGMDVVKRNIYALGGRVEIESMPGVGTRMTVRLPLTLAILDGMSIAVAAETYIVPLGYVVESLQAEPEMMKSVSGVKKLLFVRGEYLPVVVMHEIFGVPGAVTEFERGIMVIIEADGTKAALFVDALVGQQQVVIKSLEANYRKVAGVSGATIMGDGHVALILDVAVLAAMARNAMPAAA
jgi:two-component system chemotaxis sensor kinase CheA